MKFPIIEIVDRYAIAVVKNGKTNGENKEELDFYAEQMRAVNINPLQSLVTDLIDHHRTVWNLEDDFKKGRIDALPLDKIGEIAIKIRDYGHERTRLKNAIADMTGESIRDIKHYG